MDFINDYQAYILGALSTIVAGLILWLIQWYMQKDKYKLTYDIKSSDHFPVGDDRHRVFTITLTNTGNKPIIDCKVLLNTQESKIASFKCFDDRLVDETKETVDSIELFLPLLNPKEVFQITLTAKSPKEDILTPKLTARAIGVNAKRQREFSWALVVLLVIILSIAYFSWDDQRPRPQRQDRIFAALNDAGLTELFPEVNASLTDNISYKNTGYFLFHKFLVDEANREKYLRAMNLLAESEGIQDNASCTIYYLLAKAEQFRGNTDKATMYFEESDDASSETYEYLMEHDTSYDIKALQSALIKKWKILD